MIWSHCCLACNATWTDVSAHRCHAAADDYRRRFWSRRLQWALAEEAPDVAAMLGEGWAR